MQINILLFGQLADVVNSNNLHLTDINDTDAMQKKLHQLYPALAQSKYVIAVNKQLVVANTTLSSNDTIALMPPFSGG